MTILTDTVIRVRPAWADDRGASSPVWETATLTTITGCRFQPLVADELTELGRQGVVRRGTLYAPTGSFTEHDRVRIGGIDYDVDGHVREWGSPTGALAHQEVPLQRVEG